MDKEQHAKALRQAMSAAGIKSGDLATAMNVGPRTVVNWISRTKPTMPNDADRAQIKRVPGLENYEAMGDDQVLVALDRSPLLEWRRDAVRSLYKKHLYDQEHGEVSGQ